MLDGTGPAAQISIHAPHARSDSNESACSRAPAYFNPRSSCEERRYGHVVEANLAYISIHAPHARSDLTSRKTSRAAKRFQSTLLMRGATASRGRRLQKSYFNPRSSCEERRGRAARGPTLVQISIHAPHARSDARKLKQAQDEANFNPRSSCEERRPSRHRRRRCVHFNPRSSCEERRGIPAGG